MESSQVQPVLEAEDRVMQERNWKGQFKEKLGGEEVEVEVWFVYLETNFWESYFQRKAKNVLHVKNSRDFKGAVNKLQGIIGMLNKKVDLLKLLFFFSP